MTGSKAGRWTDDAGRGATVPGAAHGSRTRRGRIGSMRATAMIAVAMLMLATAPGAYSTSADGDYNPLPPASVWGRGDEAGNTNTQTPEKTLQAVSLIRSGEKFLLGHVYDREMPLFPGNSWNLEAKPPLTIVQQVANTDYFHGEIGQNGTQFDSLGHFGIHPSVTSPHETQYYNQWTHDEVHGPLGLKHLGVEKIKPFFTKAVLLDIARYANGGHTLSPGQEITLDMVRQTLAAQSMSEHDISTGDVVLFRTGWEEFYDEGTLTYFAGAPGVPGATPGVGLAVARWLGTKRVACVGADNWGIEVVPAIDPPEGLIYPVHNELIVRNGIPLQESMHLAGIAGDAAQRLRNGDPNPYTFAYVFVPVPVRGASGSPGIPIAIR
ncbi:MAG TPA: cyclase family protein [Actinomycetota bacterium]|nr:cyclase family protein [Actinomycetota bacterium]